MQSVVAKSAEALLMGRSGKPLKKTKHRVVIAAGIRSTMTASEFPLFPQRTKSWLPTTDYQYSGYYSCCLECCLRRTKSTAVVNTREEDTCCLECCQSDDPQTCSSKRAIKPRTTIHIVIDDDHHVSRTVLRRYTQLCHVSENCGGSFPMKDIQHSQTTKSSDVCSQQVLPHQKSREKYDASCSRDGVRVGRGSPCAVLLPMSMATSAP